MHVSNNNEMFILTLVALSIIGVICFGLLIVLAIFVLRRNHDRGQTGNYSADIINPQPNDAPQPTAPLQDIIEKLSEKIDNNSKIESFRYYFALGFAAVAIATGIAFSEPTSINAFTKNALAIGIAVLGFVMICQAGLKYYPERWYKHLVNWSIVFSAVGALFLLLEGVLITQFKINVSLLTIPGILFILIGAILFPFSIKTNKKRTK